VRKRNGKGSLTYGSPEATVQSIAIVPALLILGGIVMLRPKTKGATSVRRLRKIRGFCVSRLSRGYKNAEKM
jgi:hypothetical protein